MAHYIHCQLIIAVSLIDIGMCWLKGFSYSREGYLVTDSRAHKLNKLVLTVTFVKRSFGICKKINDYNSSETAVLL